MWRNVYVCFTNNLADRRAAKLKTTAYAFIEAGAAGSLKPADEARLPRPKYIIIFNHAYHYNEPAVKQAIELAKESFPAAANMEERRFLVLQELCNLLRLV